IPPGIQLEELLHADRSSVERSVDGQRAKDDPSDLQIVPSDPHNRPSDLQIVPSDLQLGTYTETTTQTTTESTTETTTTYGPDTENDVVIVLMELGLNKRQAREAAAYHHLTRTEAEQWRDWVQRLDPMKTRPVAILAAALKQQRLPPRLLQAAALSECNSPVPPADPPDAGVVPVPRSDGSVERVSLPNLWHQVQARLQPQFACTEFETWIRPTKLLDLDGQEAVVGTPNVFVRQELEQRYHLQLTEALAAEVGRPVDVLLTIQPVTTHGR
nr:hypothetical protein [Herpetosiphonaceae bacterium]